MKAAAIAGNFQSKNAPADWLALVQFDKPVPKRSWQEWLLPFSNVTKPIEGMIFHSTKSSKMGLVWLSDKEFLYGSEKEIRSALANFNGHIETGQIAKSISKKQAENLVYLAMETGPVRKMVQELATMAERFYPAMVEPYKKEIAAIAGLEYVEFAANLSSQDFGNFELTFSESQEAKVIQTFISDSIEKINQQTTNTTKGTSLSNSLIPSFGSSPGGGLGTQLQKLAIEIKNELLQTGTKTIEKGTVTGLEFQRPKKLDQLIVGAMTEFRKSQADWIRVARIQKIYQAISDFQTKNEAFPPAEYFAGDQKPETGFSWRVAVLPMLGYQDLYDKFRFDEPWDSKHNRSVAEEIPIEFCNHIHQDSAPETPCSCFHLIGGQMGLVGKESTVRDIDDIRDGADRTFMLIKLKSPSCGPNLAYSK